MDARSPIPPAPPSEGDTLQGWTYRDGRWETYVGETLVTAPALTNWHLGLARAERAAQETKTRPATWGGI